MKNTKLYNRIKDLREDKDLNQNNIADNLDITLKTYQRYERAETPITLEIAEKIANFYKVSLDYIAGRTNDKKGLTKSDLTNEETEIIKKYKYLSEKRKGMLLEKLETLYESEKEEHANRKEAI